MPLALLTSLLWGLAGAMFYCQSLFGVLPLVLGLLATHRYVAQVYPFWLINPEPRHKAFVYQFTATGFIAIGVLLILVRVQIAGFVADFLPNTAYNITTAGTVASMLASVPIFFFGSYNFYVAQKLETMRRGRRLSDKERREEIAKVTTGRLMDQKDFAQARCHENEGYFLGIHKEKPVFLRDAVHLMTYGGPGSGKSVSCVIPNILNWSHSMFITDPKGELAVMTADHRRSMGQDVIFLNPWELFGMPNTPYNPLNILLRDVKNTKNPKADRLLKEREVVDARVIAQVLLPEPPQSDQNKWVRDGAREILEAFMLYFAAHKPTLCSLIGLQKAVTYSDEEWVQALDDMSASTELRGVLASFGNSLKNSYINEPQQHANCRSEAVQAMRPFVPFGPMGKAVSIRATFDMERFVKRPTTVYLTVPGEHRDAYQSWMRLVLTIAVETVGRLGNNSQPCLFMMDEFANMGRLTNIRKGLAEYRGNGLRGWLIVQDREQLATVYPDSEAKALENLCDVVQILSCKHNHATELSQQLGNEAVAKKSIVGMTQFDQGHEEGQKQVQFEAKPILAPSQIEKLNSQQLVFARSLHPMLLDKCPYWEADPWQSQVKPNPIEISTRARPAPRWKIPPPRSTHTFA